MNSLQWYEWGFKDGRLRDVVIQIQGITEDFKVNKFSSMYSRGTYSTENFVRADDEEGTLWENRYGKNSKLIRINNKTFIIQDKDTTYINDVYKRRSDSPKQFLQFSFSTTDDKLSILESIPDKYYVEKANIGFSHNYWGAPSLVINFDPSLNNNVPMDIYNLKQYSKHYVWFYPLIFKKK